MLFIQAEDRSLSLF